MSSDIQASRVLEAFGSEGAFIAKAMQFVRSFDGTREDTFEPAAVALMLFVLRSIGAATVLDIGASHGYFARHATRVPSVTAHAFEMRPPVYEKMLLAIAGEGLSGRVIPHLVGVSDRHEGDRDVWFSGMRMFEDEPPPHAYREAWHRRLKFALVGQFNRGALSKARVEVTSMDAFVAAHALSPDLIKIDVEGYEPKVLAGGLDTLIRLRPVILFELHRDEMLARFNSTRVGVASKLFALGYSGLLLTDRRNVGRCDLVPVTADSPVFRRQKTDMLLFH